MYNEKPTDMDRFKKIFDSDKYKNLKGGRVLFKVRDVDGQKAFAQRIIDSNGLDLRVVSTGEMAAYNAFEVWEGRD
jgi:hypothetical protein